MRHLVAPFVAVALSVAAFCLAAPQAVGEGEPFAAVQFNICSRHCTEVLGVTGGANTNYGMFPIGELAAVANGERDWPRVISLNEVCPQSLWVLVTNLPPDTYSVQMNVTAHRPNCASYGNVVAVQTIDLVATDADAFGFFYSAPTPPVDDTTSENRGGVCALAADAVEDIWACSSHLTNGPSAIDEAADYRAGLDTWFPDEARLGLGDFNLAPSDGGLAEWPVEGYVDALVDYAITSEGGAAHLDYTWFATGLLSGPDPGGVAFASRSDHHMLWSAVHAP